MNTTQQREFAEAIALAQAGQKDLAYEKLLALSKATGAKDTQLLLWIAFTTPDLEEAATAIRMAEAANPDDPTILTAYNWLRAERIKPKVSKVPNPPFAPTQPLIPMPQPTFKPVVPPPANFNPKPIFNPQPLYYQPVPNIPPPATPPVAQVQTPVIQPVITPAANKPQPKTKVKVKKKRNYKRLIFFALFALVFIATLAAGIFFYLIPTIRGPEYTEYTSVAVMVDQSAPRDLVKFRAKLTFNQFLTTEEYDYYAWYTNTDSSTPGTTSNVNINPRTVRAVFARFPRQGDLRPSTRYTYYYAKVLQQGYEGQSLLVDIQKVDYTDKADLVPAYPLVQGKSLRTIRAQQLPRVGVSLLQFGYIWISTDVEISIPKDDPNIKTNDVFSDIQSSKLYLVSPDAQYTGLYKPEVVDIGNIRTEGEYIIVPATIIIQGPPDWKSLEWVVTVSQREIRTQLKL
jgi:hypothetical protein